MSDDIVYVPVPKRWLSIVYQQLAGLMAGLAADQDAAGVPDEPQASLDDQMLRQIYEDSLKPHRRLMNLMAEHPDEWRYSSEIAADLELQHGARGLAGMLGAYGRRAKHRYEGLKPWESEWDSAREEVRHMMPADVAAVIRDLARSATI
jgi:hypothetical protein